MSLPVQLDTNELQITENSLNPGTFIIALFLCSSGYLVLHSETPYAMVNENLVMFRMIWISSACMTGLSFNAVILMFFARTLFLQKVGFARFLQGFGTVSLFCSCICFVISFITLCWSYATTSTLLHIEDKNASIVLTLFLAFITMCGFITSMVTIIVHKFTTRNQGAPFPRVWER